MIRNKLQCLIIGAFFVTTINGCAITAATVAGVTAYEMNKSNYDPAKITTRLQDEVANGYFAVAVLGKTVVLAGQVTDESDITKAKNLLKKQSSDLTLYSYLKVEPIESKAQQNTDALINSKSLKLINDNIKDSGTSTVANGIVYLLVNNKPQKESISVLSDKILNIEDVKQVITIQKH